MRKINQILTLFVTLSIVACGGSESSIGHVAAEGGNIENILIRKKELVTQLKQVENEIALLDSVINASNGYENLPLITVLKVASQDFMHFVELQGGVTTKQNVLVYPEVIGTMTKVYVEEGNRVKKGQLLARIDDGGLSNQLIQMKTQFSLTETIFERQKRLWEQKIGSEIQYLQSETNYEAQKSAIKQLESQLRKFFIRMPFDGIVDDVIKDQGTVVAPGGSGSEVFRVINLSNMYIETAVPESYITSVIKGKKVKVFFSALNETIESYVRETGNYINPDNRSFVVEIPVPNKSRNIKPNLTARVQINDYRNKNAVLIPQSAISENSEGEQYAYIVTNISQDSIALARKTIITTGKTQGDVIEVLSGIDDGQNIIIEGARSVKDGQKVKILNN